MVGVAKRPKAPDCGSGIRGFESHHPPHKKESSFCYSLFYMGLGVMGFEEAGPAKRGKKVSGGHFFRPGENPITHPMKKTLSKDKVFFN